MTEIITTVVAGEIVGVGHLEVLVLEAVRLTPKTIVVKTVVLVVVVRLAAETKIPQHHLEMAKTVKDRAVVQHHLPPPIHNNQSK